MAESVGLDTPKIIGENEPLADILLQNKDLMKKGLVEGLILTIQEEESRYKTVKWKGAHEFQPASEEKALNAVKMIHSAGVHENMKNAFACLSEVITDTSENKYVTNKQKADRRGKSSKTPKENVKKAQKGTYTYIASRYRLYFALRLLSSTFQSKNFIPREEISLYQPKDRLSRNIRMAKYVSKVLYVRNKIVQAELKL